MGVQASCSVQRHQGRSKGVPRGVLEHGACLLGLLECEEKSPFGWHQDECLSATLGFLSTPDCPSAEPCSHQKFKPFSWGGPPPQPL